MKLGRISKWASLFLAIALVVPPSIVWAKHNVLANLHVHGSRIAAAQLYDAWQIRERYVNRHQVGSHTTEFPYLECDARLPRTTDKFDAALMVTFMSDHKWRLRNAYIKVLSDTLSSASATALTACLEASVLSALCAERVRELTYGQNVQVGKIIDPEDRDSASVYCRSVKAILADMRAS